MPPSIKEAGKLLSLVGVLELAQLSWLKASKSPAAADVTLS